MSVLGGSPRKGGGGGGSQDGGRHHSVCTYPHTQQQWSSPKDGLALSPSESPSPGPPPSLIGIMQGTKGQGIQPDTHISAGG